MEMFVSAHFLPMSTIVELSLCKQYIALHKILTNMISEGTIKDANKSRHFVSCCETPVLCYNNKIWNESVIMTKQNLALT